MATTTNFGWETPDDTDLVKDGALAIRTLGSAIDTSLVDLKGGTTGQVLSKNTNTDMDFTWITQNDADAIQNTIVDAKGDLITATAADTPARLAVGTNGHVLTADSTTATGLKWAAVAAGGGKVAQVVSTTTSTNTNISGTTFTDITNYSVTITPTANTSKILVLGSFSQKSIGPNDSDSCFRILRGATEVYSVGSATYGYFATNTNNIGSGASQAFVYLDSPATTSATTYKVQARGGQATTTAYCNAGSGAGVTSQATITVLEILA